MKKRNFNINVIIKTIEFIVEIIIIIKSNEKSHVFVFIKIIIDINV